MQVAIDGETLEMARRKDDRRNGWVVCSRALRNASRLTSLSEEKRKTDASLYVVEPTQSNV